MSGIVSIELLDSEKGAANGLASLDGTGKIPIAQLPTSSVETYKGQFATSTVLITAYPSGSIADYAYVTASLSFWYWNYALTVPAWVNQVITHAAYNLLTTAQKAALPYIIVPV
jgi:hypothetical protein